MTVKKRIQVHIARAPSLSGNPEGDRPVQPYSEVHTTTVPEKVPLKMTRRLSFAPRSDPFENIPLDDFDLPNKEQFDLTRQQTFDEIMREQEEKKKISFKTPSLSQIAENSEIFGFGDDAIKIAQRRMKQQ